jgi:D-glycero-alpha-D-manno-heptose 1-phosphate guanylyltransferase
MLQIPDVVILAGGAGLRLKSVTGETPKPMAKIGERPFLELLLHQLKRQGFVRIILSLGQKQQMIREHFGEKTSGLHLCYSVEQVPLGTGGALRQSVLHVVTDSFLALNGDSYTDVNLNQLVEAHLICKANVTMAVIPDSRNDAGSVIFDEEGKVTAFAEKQFVRGSSYRSAGIYMLNRALMEEIGSGVNISLEEQLFPKWLASGKHIQAFVSPARCIDIGTPERYREAQVLLASVESNESIIRNEGQL